MKLEIVKYTDDMEIRWDNFIENESMNGTFLNSRRFLNYHPKTRFKDHSLIIYKSNEIAAVIPACEIHENNKKVLFSHKGSTFGGIILNKKFYNIEHTDTIVNKLQEYLKYNNFSRIIMRNTSDIFCSERCDLIEYFLFKNGYKNYDELSFYIDFSNYDNNISLNFTSSKRRDYKYSIKNSLYFRRILDNKEVKAFYQILVNNLKKHNVKPVHTFEELIDFKENRLKEIVDFYGVFYKNIIIAGSMVFKFKKQVFHTQYLASDENYLKMFPMDYLNYNLIKEAKNSGYRYFSFGISTENCGSMLNYGLAKFKEGFGTKFLLNRTFYKDLKEDML